MVKWADGEGVLGWQARLSEVIVGKLRPACPTEIALPARWEGNGALAAVGTDQQADFRRLPRHINGSANSRTGPGSTLAPFVAMQGGPASVAAPGNGLQRRVGKLFFAILLHPLSIDEIISGESDRPNI